MELDGSADIFIMTRETLRRFSFFGDGDERVGDIGGGDGIGMGGWI